MLSFHLLISQVEELRAWPLTTTFWMPPFLSLSNSNKFEHYFKNNIFERFKWELNFAPWIHENPFAVADPGGGGAKGPCPPPLHPG